MRFLDVICGDLYVLYDLVMGDLGVNREWHIYLCVYYQKIEGEKTKKFLTDIRIRMRRQIEDNINGGKIYTI